MALQLTTRATTRATLEKEILLYLATMDDSVRWKDYFESSTGKTLIDLLIGISELLLYKLETRSLDSYLLTSISKPAAYLLSQMVGYNPNRKFHSLGTVRCEMDFVNEASWVVPAGYLFDAEVPLVTTENTVFPVGETSVVVKVMQGEWVDLTFSVDNDNLKGNSWEILKIDSNDFKVDQKQILVQVDGELIKCVDKVEKVDANSVIVRTDYLGGVFLLFGDGEFGYKLRPSSIVKVRYLSTLGFDGVLPAGTQLGSFIISQEIIRAVVESSVQGGSNEDDIDKIKFLASRFFQTQGRAVTRWDYQAILMSYPGVISAQARKNTDTCCTIQLCGLKTTHAYWSQSEVDDLFTYLYDYAMLSARLEWVQPQPVEIQIHITIVVPPLFNNFTIEQEVEDYIKKTYCYQLGNTLYPTRVVDNVTDMFSDVIRSYITQLNGVNDTYLDINLEFYQYFKPSVVQISRRVEIPQMK